MSDYSIFIIDDEETIRDGLGLALAEKYRLSTFASAEPALEALQEQPPDLVLLDIGLPGIDGIEALRLIKERMPQVIVVMITAYESLAMVVSAMKLGAHDYVIKPIQLDAIELTIGNALETLGLRREVQDLQERYLREQLPCFVGESDVITDMMEFISRVAKSADTPILILGETGTGKELIARAIHTRSPNCRGPFVAVNCAAIPRELLESELFGYLGGAFSGAKNTGKRGLVEEAAGGTLFLDEVADLGLEAQAKLLRFLEHGEFYKVGSTAVQKVATRVVSATNSDLEKRVAGEKFRRDLFYRLGVINIRVPALSERTGDVILLAQHFLAQFNHKFKTVYRDFSESAKNALLGHKWLGNVRELKNVVERGVLTGDGQELTVEDLGLHGQPRQHKAQVHLLPELTDSGVDLPAQLKNMERHYMEKALELTSGNETRAAKLLNMNHHTFRYHRRQW